MHFTAAPILALAALVAGLPTTNYVLHEKRSATTTWLHKDGVELDSRVELPIRVALTESNLDAGEELLMRVSDPDRDTYGQHYTADEVGIAFRIIRLVLTACR